MRKAFGVAALAALVAVCLFTGHADSQTAGGFPSRPKFGQVTISGAAVPLTVTSTGATQVAVLNGNAANSYVDLNRSGVLTGRIGSADSVIASGTATDLGISSPAGGICFATGGSSTSRLCITSTGRIAATAGTLATTGFADFTGSAGTCTGTAGIQSGATNACTRNSTGVYNVGFVAGTFNTNNPTCQVQPRGYQAGGQVQANIDSYPSNNNVIVSLVQWTSATVKVAIDGEFTLVCYGNT